jgi:toxin ParE1/3/4
MRKLAIRPQARVDLLEIWHCIAQDSPTAADVMYDRLGQGIRELPRWPGVGHTRHDVPKSLNLLFWQVEPYIIAYRFDDKSDVVERVVHGSRDFRRLFPRKR